ncbi:MAG: hypothetical protein Q7R51_02270 [bacterium]|nr:hypothetical protein [bacterium]
MDRFIKLENLFIDQSRKYAIPMLRISLAIVYIWFGMLKIFNVSPVADLIKSTYPTYPEPLFLFVLGVWEVVIGLGLLFKIFLKFALILFWLQMGGIFLGLFLASNLYFTNENPLLLSTNGEFVIKNIVFIAASLIIVGHELKGKKPKK